MEGDKIIKKYRQEKYYDQEAGMEKVRYEWYCDHCRKTIQPLLKVQMAQRLTTSEIPLFHPVGLRNLIEIHLGVDNNYKSLS